MYRRYLLALALALFLALPASAQTTPDPAPANGSAAATSTDLFRRMTELNAKLKSYKAVIHASISLKTFPFISHSLDGTVYFKAPDQQAAEFETVPALANEYKKASARIEPPSEWTKVYTVSVVGDQGGTTTFRLVPLKNGRVDHLDVLIDDSLATIKGYTWTYKDNGYITFTQEYRLQNGFQLVTRQTGHVEQGSYKGDVVNTFEDYSINVPIDDAVFKTQ